MLTVKALCALNDNYIWVIENPNTKTCVLVDPSEAEPVLHYLQGSANKLAAILITHHHFDHVGGIKGIKEHYNAPVYGPATEQIPLCSNPVKEPDQFSIADIGQFSVIDIPGHTLGHIAYLHQNLLFCGDTLFAGGCGRVFEGTHQQMVASLHKLAALPYNTHVYCAHEYTQANLEFAIQVEPNNQVLRQRLHTITAMRQEGKVTIPSLLQMELATNPFLRCQEQDVIAMAQQRAGKTLTSEVDVFGVIREWKNRG